MPSHDNSRGKKFSRPEVVECCGEWSLSSDVASPRDHWLNIRGIDIVRAIGYADGPKSDPGMFKWPNVAVPIRKKVGSVIFSSGPNVSDERAHKVTYLFLVPISIPAVMLKGNCAGAVRSGTMGLVSSLWREWWLMIPCNLRCSLTSIR